MKFTDQLWNHIEPIYERILDHPFIRELTEGTLSRERFVFYLKQDALYLADFTRALSLAGLRSSDLQHTRTYLEFALGAVTVERALHETYFETFGVSPTAEKAPACFAYTHFLLSTASVKDNAESLSALLPCFWIYREVGNHIYERAEKDNPYSEWIDTYAGEEFSESVDRAIEVTDVVAEQSTKETRRKMQQAFEHSSRLEWMFWDSAWRLEQWPPEEGEQ